MGRIQFWRAGRFVPGVSYASPAPVGATCLKMIEGQGDLVMRLGMEIKGTTKPIGVVVLRILTKPKWGITKESDSRQPPIRTFSPY